MLYQVRPQIHVYVDTTFIAKYDSLVNTSINVDRVICANTVHVPLYVRQKTGHALKVLHAKKIGSISLYSKFGISNYRLIESARTIIVCFSVW